MTIPIPPEAQRLAAPATTSVPLAEPIPATGEPPITEAGMARAQLVSLIANQVPTEADIPQMRMQLARAATTGGLDVGLLMEGLALAEQQQVARRRVGSRAGTEVAFGASFGALASLTAGITPTPREMGARSPQAAMGQAIGELLGLGTIGIGTYKLVGRFALRPLMPTLSENIVGRIAAMVVPGMVAGAASDAARPEGLPEDPAGIDFPARLARKFQPVLGERGSLALGGAIVGGAFDFAFGGLIRGLEFWRTANIAGKLSDEGVNFLRQGLVEAGIPVDPTASRAHLVRLAEANRHRLRTPEGLAGVMAQEEARTSYAAQFVYNFPEAAALLQDETEALYIAGLVLSAPEGVSVARNIKNPNVIAKVAQALGVRIMATSGTAGRGALPVGGQTVVMMRPPIHLPEFTVTEAYKNKVRQLRRIIKSRQGGTTVDPTINILADGSTVIGGFSADEVLRELRLSEVRIAGAVNADVSVREGLRLARIELTPEAATIHIPSGLTRPQLNAIRQQVDRLPQELVNIVPIRQGAPSIAMRSPVGLQVEDTIAKMLGIGPTKIESSLVEKAIQFDREGVFSGQAGILANKQIVKVVGRKAKTIQVEDALTGTKLNVHEDQLMLLPHELTGSLHPSRVVWNALSDKERELYTVLLKANAAGLAEPVTTMAQLRRIAQARGFQATKLEDDAIRLTDLTTGEGQTYKNIKAAVAGIRDRWDPSADLTPYDLRALMGESGGIGVGMPDGTAPAWGERVPMSDLGFDMEAIKEIVGAPGFEKKGATLTRLITPTEPLLRELERRTGLPFHRTFLAVEEGQVHRNNFIARWALGLGTPLPEGIKPIGKVLSGVKEGTRHRITDWLQATDDVARAEIAREFSAKELEAAKDARKWYDAFFKEVGFEAEYLSNYAPHLRVRNATTATRNLEALWRSLNRGQPVPKGVLAASDMSRRNILDIYETDALKAATQYVTGAANARHLNGALDDAKRFLFNLRDAPNVVKKPFSDYLEAIQGVEFFKSNEAISSFFRKVFGHLGMKLEGDVADRMALNLLGLSYSATMAFRVGLALRNMAQTLQTTWVMFGGLDDSMAQAIRLSVTSPRQAAQEAVADGAINLLAAGRYAAEELRDTPEFLKHMQRGFIFYDTADRWSRVVAYHTVKIRSMKALTKFSEVTKGVTDVSALNTARRELIRESGAYAMARPIVDEFLRRAVHSPEQAAGWLGKKASDVTLWLYGKGNQARWLRSVPGRFFGQFGTWPMWYLDFMIRTPRNMIANGYYKEAAAFIGRMALVDGALLAATGATGLELWKWSASHSLFYNGGPGMEVAGGLLDIVRGSGEVIFDPNNEFGPSRVQQGLNILGRVGRAYVPYYYAVRDYGRIINPSTPREHVAAWLSLPMTPKAELQQMLDLMHESGVLSTDLDIQDRDPSLAGQPTGTQRARDILERPMRSGLRLPPPSGQPLTPPPGQPPVGGGAGTPMQRIQGGQGALRGGQPTQFPGESRPIQQ